jgi:uncharacterized oligopeptide transporter (OPT) family protein
MGIFFGIALILMQVKSPMLISVGMYLPIGTSFSIFIGGLLKGLSDIIIKKRNLSDEQKESINNKGILISSGLIAGEALIGLLFAGMAFGDIRIFAIFENPGYLLSLASIAIIGMMLIFIPLKGHKK